MEGSVFRVYNTATKKITISLKHNRMYVFKWTIAVVSSCTRVNIPNRFGSLKEEFMLPRRKIAYCVAVEVCHKNL